MTRLPKPFRVGVCHCRTTHLRPAKDQPSVCLVQPFQVNLALGRGQSPVLGGIGRQLVQGYSNGLSRVGL